MSPLERARKLKGINKSAAAKLCGIDRAHYGRIESGYTAPSLELAKNMAERFGNTVTRDQILFPSDYADVEQLATKAV